MKVFSFTFSLLAIVWLNACSSYKSTLTEGVDVNIKPQQDFYRYVNGKWLKTAQIPQDKISWGTLAELNELNDQRALALLQSVIVDHNLQTDPKAQRIKALYESYINVDAREKLGLSPILAEIAQIESIRTMDDLTAYLIEETKAGNGSLFGWAAFAHLEHSKQNAVYLFNQELGLKRDYFQKESVENQQILNHYQRYIVALFNYAGIAHAAEKAKQIVAYEKKIAQTLFTNEQSRNIRLHNNPIAFSALKKLSKNIDLADFLRKVGVNTDEVILWEPHYFKRLDSLINSQNIATIKNYLLFKKLSAATGYLTQELNEIAFDFYGRKLIGQKSQRSLEQRGLQLVNNSLGEDFAQFYVTQFFPERAKKDLLEITHYLISAYHTRINNLDWMSAETKRKAIIKLNKFKIEVGYPNRWKDYSNLTLKTPEQGGTLYGNLRKLAVFEYQQELKKIGQPVDINEWGMLPQVVNASYDPLMNRIVFPAGILQSPLYDVDADPAVNFGAIGAIIGHEITHGFDDSGSHFDGDGNLVNWWSDEDRKKFESLADQLVAQFNQFEVAPNVHVNGRFTLGENIADLGGLSIAYDALKLYEKEKGQSPTLEGLHADQRFFMSWTRSWRAKATVESLTHQVKSDPHAPAEFRAFAPVLNISGFHQAFQTQKGDKMYRSASERIKIW